MKQDYSIIIPVKVITPKANVSEYVSTKLVTLRVKADSVENALIEFGNKMQKLLEA